MAARTRFAPQCANPHMHASNLYLYLVCVSPPDDAREMSRRGALYPLSQPISLRISENSSFAARSTLNTQ